MKYRDFMNCDVLTKFDKNAQDAIKQINLPIDQCNYRVNVQALADFAGVSYNFFNSTSPLSRFNLALLISERFDCDLIWAIKLIMPPTLVKYCDDWITHCEFGKHNIELIAHNMGVPEAIVKTYFDLNLKPSIILTPQVDNIIKLSV